MTFFSINSSQWRSRVPFETAFEMRYLLCATLREEFSSVKSGSKNRSWRLRLIILGLANLVRVGCSNFISTVFFSSTKIIFSKINRR